MNESLKPYADRLIGVIDLLGGQAVHASGGNRHEYRPVDFCSGDPSRLVQHYLDRQVREIYLADLDSILDQSPNVRALSWLFGHKDHATINHWWVDWGWRGDESLLLKQGIKRCANEHKTITWIAATESMNDVDSLARLVDLVGADRVALGLDYRDGKLLGSTNTETQCLEFAISLGIHSFVILDLANIGASLGPTTTTACRRVHSFAPRSQIISGGGIRNAADLQILEAAGCQRSLVATALYPRE